MIRINDNFTKLPISYLFSEVARRIDNFKAHNPTADIVRMGIGDVSLPICEAAIKAMHKAVDDQASASTFHGYGPEQGYAFLREKIAEHDYRMRGIEVSIDEIFISDGAKSDTGNIGDILSPDSRIAVTDPVYPVYVDTNVMAGRGGNLANGQWDMIEYLPCTSDNGFIPALPAESPDVIYLCYPNNPTGTSLTKDQLAEWVRYAIDHKCLILFDSAYEAYIRRPDVPHSIYEIPGAKDVAIEFRSFSKTAGFTGLRCGYTVVPEAVKGKAADGTDICLNALWRRRQCTKFNGASYVIQRGAEALYSEEGKAQVRGMIDYYMRNATLLRDGLRQIGLEAYGGEDAPYIWVKAPRRMSSWEFFDKLLKECNIACTPGSGFGPAGEGYVRLTAFSHFDDTVKAVERIKLLRLD